MALFRAVSPTPRGFAGLALEITLALVAAELTLVLTTSSLRRELFWYWSRFSVQRGPLHGTGE
jgi:hypothetical protein